MEKIQVLLPVTEVFSHVTLCVMRSHLQQLVAAEQLATAADGALREDRADVVVATVCFQTDAQAAALTELLHLSHLSETQSATRHFNPVLCDEGRNR